MEKRAYNALITLLDDGSTRKKRKSSSSRSVIAARNPSITEKANIEIEGLETLETEEPAHNAKDDAAEEIEQIEVNDDNEGDHQDPFEIHFAHPAELNVDAIDGKWTSTPAKLDLAGEKSILSLPPNPLLPSPRKVHRFEDLKIKHRLLAAWQKCNPQLSELQLELSTSLFGYQDILFPSRTVDNSAELQKLYILHAINHVFKTRDRIIKNNALVNAEDVDDDSLRDQGFTRPKVLFLVPTRHAAFELVQSIHTVSGLRQFENRKRFVDAFDGQGSDLSSKPQDFQQLFAGNTDDLFCLGMKFTRQALKLYASFYQSDIIVASPLGLRMLIGKGDFDFLSSIEILIADQLDAIQMQAWDNMTEILTHMNKMPKESHDCDFSRLRSWYLDDHARYLRQTIFISSFITPEMTSASTKLCLNLAGRLRCRPVYQGALSKVGIKIRQIFTRIGPHPYISDFDAKFNHFTTVTLPSILRGAQTEGTLIVVPNYLEFVKVRNYLEKNDMSYVSMSEYTSPSQQSRGRAFFADGRAKMMLYSCRLHHYRRYSLKGVRNVIFYGLPDNPQFYIEIVRYLARTVIEHGIDPEVLKVQSTYSKWDALKLERIVGTKRLGPLLEGSSDIYDFH